MSDYYEDIDEALAEYDDESDDEGLFSRRRKRRNRNRGGYAPQAAQRGAVSQTQWARSMERVGDDVQDTASAIKKLQADQQNFAQMSMLMPLLLKGKAVEVPTISGGTAKVAEQGDSTIGLLLPMMMMMGSTSSSSTSSGSNNSMMMMMLMLVVLSSNKDKPIL